LPRSENEDIPTEGMVERNLGGRDVARNKGGVRGGLGSKKRAVRVK